MNLKKIQVVDAVLCVMRKQYVDANDVSVAFGVSKGKAYEIIRELNASLRAEGYITVAGRCPKRYFEEKYYGFEVEKDAPTNQSQASNV